MEFLGLVYKEGEGGISKYGTTIRTNDTCTFPMILHNSLHSSFAPVIKVAESLSACEWGETGEGFTNGNSI